MRSINISFYSLAVYDPDPISSMRRRRVSNDSVDSGSGDLRGLHMQRPPQMAPLTSYAASVSQLTPSPRKQRGTPPSAKNSSSSSAEVSSASAAKKRHHRKRHRHHSHSCAKHKKKGGGGGKKSGKDEDGQLKIKLDGSFNNTTTYSIRSPGGGMGHQQGTSAVSAAAAAKASEDKDADDGDDEEEEEEEDTSSESSTDEDEVGRRRNIFKVSILVELSCFLFWALLVLQEDAV